MTMTNRGHCEAHAKHHPPALSVKERKLLGRVISYYQHTFVKDQRGINYLKNECNLTDNATV